jgi:cysteine desulfurase
LISAVEHPASRAAAAALQRRGWQVQEVPVDRLGAIDLEAFERQLAPPTRLVSLIWGQSEVGTIQPVEPIAALCRNAGVLLHLDAVQVLGHQPLRLVAFPVDLLSFAAHKIQGPRCVGALVVKPGVLLQPCIGGGGQEGGLRSGTEAVALVAGFEAALQLATNLLTSTLGHGVYILKRQYSGFV